MKSIYTIYKERLVEISGKSRSIFSKKGNTKYSCDIVELLGSNEHMFKEFIKLFWNGNNASFPLVNKDVIKNLYLNSDEYNNLINSEEYLKLLKKDQAEAKKYLNTQANKTIKKMINDGVNAFSKLKKEIVDLAKETGRYELYIGYPFVHGTLKEEIQFKAPLLLFPVKINIINDSNVTIEPIKDMPITLNKSLMFAYANERKLNIDEMNMEFNGNLSNHFKDINGVLHYLKKNHINLKLDNTSISTFTSSGLPTKHDDLKVVNHCVIGRYPLANSIYNDYNELEKKKATTNRVIEELIHAKSSKKKNQNKVNSIYPIYKLDYTQEKAIEKINDDGSVVIYGPPGTGKSQTIVNVISDALARKKRVLVVSQKKAALDVVYNRLGKLKDKAMFISDPEKEREAFYKKVLDSHNKMSIIDSSNESKNHADLEKEIDKAYKEIEMIFKVLYQPGEFGVSLETMYEQSSQISKNSYDYQIYQELISRKNILNIKYDELERALANINQNNRKSLYYKYLEMKEKNSVIEHLKNDLDIYTIEKVSNTIEKMLVNKHLGFDTSKYPYSEYLIADLVSSENVDDVDVKKLVNWVAKHYRSGIFISGEFKRELTNSFIKAKKEIQEQLKEFEFLKEILTNDGYKMVVNAILNGNTKIFNNLRQGLKNYTKITDIKVELNKLSDIENTILEFAYNKGETLNKYNQIIDNFMPIRFYIEIVKLEQDKKGDLAKIMNFESIRQDILNMKDKQNILSNKIALSTFNEDYLNKFNKNKNNKDYLYQISKQQNNWPIRKFMKEYLDYMLDLYPCWLLSPENVSTIMPLVKDMFDIVLVDEASQVFIENTLPIMYRAKNMVVAGDNKQLRPTSVFMKRYMGSDVEENVDPTTEAALEVESLLDLATSRLPAVNLNYHYRSKNEELIDFSNNYFYDGKLEVVPNLVGSKKNGAIARIKVNGKWAERRNDVEAKKVVEILKDTLKNRKNKESIGIITFNSEQAYAIEEAIRKECKNDSWFAEAILMEQNRFENNVDTSLFVKNIENVQGDERDVIILSVGYAYNDKGKVVANFGSLSSEGGENRLNVAITRAKERTFVVTSIEPEELNVANTKNEGPKILKKYLSYVRAVSNNNKKEARIWLNNKKESVDDEITNKDIIANEIREALIEEGYRVDVKVGNTKNKVDLAIYDPDLDQYLLGIDCINKEYKDNEELIENQIYHLSFLESRGWNIHRVWTRDWWLNKNRVINSIIRSAENAKKEIINNKINNKKRK